MVTTINLHDELRTWCQEVDDGVTDGHFSPEPNAELAVVDAGPQEQFAIRGGSAMLLCA
jgi:hypothetical protein